jgi:fructokinase
MKMNKKKILSVGEILWDSLPQGLFLGGAPFNVACHLNMLNEDCKMISRVGSDLLGEQAIRRLREKGMSSEYIQVDEKYNTGFVDTSIDLNGNATYKIIEPVAWDFIELNENIDAQVLIFGSLAQRNPKSRFAISALRQIIPFRVFDINLRPPYDNPEIVKESLKGTNIVKLNDAELTFVIKMFDLPSEQREAVIALSDLFNTDTVCVTHSEKGASLWNKKTWTEHPGFKVKVKDTIGSGDAFLAALVSGLIAEKDNYEVLAFANAVGAYVASNYGATPVLQFDKIYDLLNK